jgi:hypothetical protein
VWWYVRPVVVVAVESAMPPSAALRGEIKPAALGERSPEAPDAAGTCASATCIRQHSSAFVSIRGHTWTYVSIRAHTRAYREVLVWRRELQYEVIKRPAP